MQAACVWAAACRYIPRDLGMPRHAVVIASVLIVVRGTPSLCALQVAVMTTLMGSASGLGAVPFFFVGSLSAEWAALANALACGVMLAASFDLVHEGQPYGAGLTILGVILGAPSSSTSPDVCCDRPLHVLTRVE